MEPERNFSRRVFLSGIMSFLIITSIMLGIQAVSIGDDVNIVENDVTDGLVRKGVVCYQVVRGEGSIYGEGVEDLGCFDNLVVDTGLDAVKDCFGGGSCGSAYSVIGLCNLSASCPTPVAGDTDLNDSSEFVSSGLSRASATYTSLGTGNWSIFTTFTSSGMSGLITNKTCLFNSTTVAGSNMLACNLFTHTTLDGLAGDQLTVNWTNFVTSG